MIQGVNFRGLIDLGFLQMNLYGLVYFLGFLAVFFTLERYLSLKGIKEKTFSAIVYLMIGTIVGARVFYVLYYYPSLILRPVEAILLWNGGMSFHGALVGAFASGYIFARKNNLDAREFADAIILPAIVFLILGRIVNFLDAEIYGKISEVFWCVVFPGVSGCRHPVQIYEAIVLAGIFLALIFFRKKLLKGEKFMVFLFSYLGIRFFLDFFREYSWSFLGLGAGQYLDLLFLFFSIGMRRVWTDKN